MKKRKEDLRHFLGLRSLPASPRLCSASDSRPKDRRVERLSYWQTEEATVKEFPSAETTKKLKTVLTRRCWVNAQTITNENMYLV